MLVLEVLGAGFCCGHCTMEKTSMRWPDLSAITLPAFRCLSESQSCTFCDVLRPTLEKERSAGFRAQTAAADSLMPAIPSTRCLTMGKSLRLWVPHFPLL